MAEPSLPTDDETYEWERAIKEMVGYRPQVARRLGAPSRETARCEPADVLHPYDSPKPRADAPALLHGKWTAWSNQPDREERRMSTTIQEQSDAVKAASAQRLPTAVLETFTRDQAAWRAKGQPAGAAGVGDVLSDFTYPTRPAGTCRSQSSSPTDPRSSFSMSPTRHPGSRTEIRLGARAHTTDPTNQRQPTTQHERSSPPNLHSPALDRSPVHR